MASLIGDEDFAASLKPAIASMSLGRAWVHKMEPKLRAAAAAGFKGIEVFFEDMAIPAEKMFDTNFPAADPDLFDDFSEATRIVARTFRGLCDELSLEVVSLQPFRNYEGLLDDKRRSRKIDIMRVWISIARILKCDLILVPATFLVDTMIITDDMEKRAFDLRILCDMGLQVNPVVRFAYENMAWARHAPTWRDAWQLVKMVNRPNMGICLDTFQVLAQVWGNPMLPSGYFPNCPARLRANIQQMIDEIPPHKIFLLQLADAEKVDECPPPSHTMIGAQQHPLLRWSRTQRTFPGEAKYLPAIDLFIAWVRLGYRGWVSMEVFHHRQTDKGPDIPVEFAQRGFESWKRAMASLEEARNMEIQEILRSD